MTLYGDEDYLAQWDADVENYDFDSDTDTEDLSNTDTLDEQPTVFGLSLISNLEIPELQSEGTLDSDAYVIHALSNTHLSSGTDS